MADHDRALAELLEAGDVEGVLGFFAGMPEKARRAHAKQCKAWAAPIRRNAWVETAARTMGRNPLAAAANVATFCVGTLAELGKLSLGDLPEDGQQYRILLDRRPAWLEGWVEHRLAAERYWFAWPLVRRLVLAGVVPKPEHPHYALGMISGLTWGRGRDATIRQGLEADPGLLEDEVWRLFEHEGGGRNSLANNDRFRPDGWADSLRALAEEGRLDRTRLLGGAIEALRRDFNHYRARWFTRFYDGLKPTKDEDLARAEAFLQLLGASAPNVVTWAFARVKALAERGAYAPEALLQGLDPVLRARTKGLVLEGLARVRSTVAEQPSLRPEAARLALLALGHESADMQAAALDLMDEVGTPGGLAQHVDLVATSLRDRVAALCGHTVKASPAAAPVADLSAVPVPLRELYALDVLAAQPGASGWQAPAATFDGTELPRLARAEPLQPLDSLDAVVETVARGLEGELDADDVERVLDAIARTCDERPADFERRVGPLLRRAEVLMSRGSVPFAGLGPADDLCGVVLAWATERVATVEIGERHRTVRVTVTFDGFTLEAWGGNLFKTLGVLSRRAQGIANRVAQRQAGPLLAAPTHAGGLIDPRALATRVRDWSGPDPDPVEVVLAMLRLAPEGRERARALLGAPTAQWQRAIVHAMGGEVQVGTTVSLWCAAARSRAPWAIDPAVRAAFGDAGPDVGIPADYAVAFVPNPGGWTELSFPQIPAAQGFDAETIPVILHHERGDSMWELGGIGGRTADSIRWTASAWPTARESYFAGAASMIYDNLNWGEARWYAKTLLEPLLEPGTPLRRAGALLLALALGAKEPGEHGLAVDAAIVAIEDGRLGSDNLGWALGTCLDSGRITPGRWAKTLASVAEVSPAHALVVKLALETLLPRVSEPPRDLAKLIGLLHELSVALGYGVDAGREHLEGLRGSNKLAKLGRALHGISVDDAGSMQAAMQALLAMRVQAATAWA